MSIRLQTDCIFLPTSILKYATVGLGTPRIHPELIIEKATTSEIRDLLNAFYPHFIFDETAKDDRKLLISVFEKLVARRLSYVVMPSHNSPPSYFKAPLEHTVSTAHQFERIISSELDINCDRINMFTSFGLSNLEMGNYRLAAEGLINFIRTYNHLSEDEIDDIEAFHEHAQDALHDSTTLLENIHESIEGIQLLLREVNISSNQQHRFRNELKRLMMKLESRQLIFDRNVEQAGFISALVEYHKNLSAKYQCDISADKLSPLSKHDNQDGVNNMPCMSEIHAAHDKSQVTIENDVSDIACAYEDSLVALDKILSLLTDAHKEVEAIHLLVSQAEISPIQCEELENALKSKLATLNSRKMTFNQSVQETGLISALLEYHNNPFVENVSDIAEDSNISPLSKDVEGDTTPVKAC